MVFAIPSPLLFQNLTGICSLGIFDEVLVGEAKMVKQDPIIGPNRARCQACGFSGHVEDFNRFPSDCSSDLSCPDCHSITVDREEERSEKGDD